ESVNSPRKRVERAIWQRPVIQVTLRTGTLLCRRKVAKSPFESSMIPAALVSMGGEQTVSATAGRLGEFRKSAIHFFAGFSGDGSQMQIGLGHLIRIKKLDQAMLNERRNNNRLPDR
ncbi:hypothetical protein R3X27_10665, partial [Tropicimonas sp. TH_r6]|uniref:hypothetical protein n=1 Tax=Tropicimonas sp. TH_r6 TaxID=3082085 RepID=UPI00295444A5